MSFWRKYITLVAGWTGFCIVVLYPHSWQCTIGAFAFAYWMGVVSTIYSKDK